MIFFTNHAVPRWPTLAVVSMVWENIHANEFSEKAPSLYRGVVQVVNHAYTHVLKHTPPTTDYTDNWWGEFSISYSTDDSFSTPYVNVVRGASYGPFRHHDLSINARRHTVKVNGQYKPLEGTAEHVSTLDSLCMWVKTHAEARAAQAARREEMRRRQEEERRRLEADPVWQEQQREAARRRKQAEEEAAANCAEQQRIAAEQRRIAEEQWRIAEEQAAQAKRAAWEAKARLLAAKVQSGPGTCDAPGSSAAQQEEQVPVAASGSEQANIEQPSELAIQLASCQECKDHMQFCSDKDCVILILDSCKCRESIMHAALTDDMGGEGADCGQCGKYYCVKHDSMERCMNECCEEGAFCSSCSDLTMCEECQQDFCSECINSRRACECWVYEEDYLYDDGLEYDDY